MVKYVAVIKNFRRGIYCAKYDHPRSRNEIGIGIMSMRDLNPCLKDHISYLNSDSFTILGLWVLRLAVSNESNCKLMSPDHYFQ